MDDEEDSNIFAGIPAFDDESTTAELQAEPSNAGQFLSQEELAKLPRDELLIYIEALQKHCAQLENENKFRSWEFREYQENLTYFSRAAKLAHKLNSADLNEIACVAIEDIRVYFNCNYAALFLYNLELTRFEIYRSTRPDMQKKLTVGRETLFAKLFANYQHPFLMTFCEDRGVAILDNGETLESDIPGEWLTVLGENALVFPLQVKQGDSIDPLTLGGMVLGDARRELVVKDAEVATFFADLLSSSLYNARLLKRLNDLTIIDPLTQIYNRRHLINQLNSAMIQAKRQGHPLSIVMVDIDFFKRFNDRYGHICGDEVLRSVANTLKNGIRAGVDVPARYGGEEFVLVMPFTDEETAVMVSNRIRTTMRDSVVHFEGKDLSVTSSFGVAQYNDNESLENFIDRADEALYRAKKSGRDKVCGTNC